MMALRVKALTIKLDDLEFNLHDLHGGKKTKSHELCSDLLHAHMREGTHTHPHKEIN